MKINKYLSAAFLMIGISTALGAVAVNAQENISGTYIYVSSLKENPVKAALELKTGGEAVLTMSKTEKGDAEKRQIGNWKYDKSTKTISLELPDSTDNLIFREEIMTFKIAGKRLKYVKPEYKEDIFGEFVKTSSKKKK